MTNPTRKVIAGPAGHWYALIEWEGRDCLVGMPMSAEGSGFPHDINDPPKHPELSNEWDAWLDITDPAPETDVDALIAESQRVTLRDIGVRRAAAERERLGAASALRWAIRKSAKDGKSKTAIAVEAGISRQTVHEILRHR